MELFTQEEASMAISLILSALLMGGLGLFLMLSDPEALWWSTEAWRYRDPEANEPSERQYAANRGAGCFMVVLALILVALPFLPALHSVSDAETTSADSAGHCMPYAYGCDSGDASPSPRPTASGETVDPLSSAVASPVASGAPVTLFTPVVEGAVQHHQSDSSEQIGVNPVYYPWTASDQPAAFASAAVIDSKVALATLDPAQATTEGAGGSVLGERTYIVVQLSEPACAITSASASLSDDQTRISISVYGISDLSRCGQPTEGAYVAIPLSDELIQAARSYQAPVYHPLAPTTSPSGASEHTPDPVPGNAWSSTSYDGDYMPTIFRSNRRGKFTETWKDPVTDADIDRNTLVPWVAPGSS